MAVLGKGVEYALHCLLYLSNPPDTHSLAVGDIARFQGVSETYLAKVFTKLKKAGLVRSALGAKGGYELARPPEQITFWDVAVAVEGEVRLFECWNIREKDALCRGKPRPDWAKRGPCTIHQVMMDAEAQVKAALGTKTLAWLAQEVNRKDPKHQEQAARWFLQIASPES